jgi:formamidopyrimidine-DNA glycosylase
MPELPEVETMCRGIACIVGCRIEEVCSPSSGFRPIEIRPSLAEFCRRVRGRTIVGVGRLGKRVSIELDGDEKIVIEPRMTGCVLLAAPPDRDHLRVIFSLSGGDFAELFFWDSRGLGVVRLLTADECACQLGPKRLGPDALEATLDDLRTRLAPNRRPIKVVLMDQQAIAGIGNIYASEILHLARLHPELPCDRLRLADWERLHHWIGEVLREAIEHQGSTLADRMYRNAQNESGGFQERHQVYQRAGRPCLTCRRPIVRIVQAQRSTFYCPKCQPVRKRKGD